MLKNEKNKNLYNNMMMYIKIDLLALLCKAGILC
jgi:hypothetical protein